MHIFYCAGGKIGEVTGETLTGRWPTGTGRRVCASGVQAVPGSARVRHQTPSIGHRLDPVGASSDVSPVLCAFAMLSGYEIGEHRTDRCPARLQTSLCLTPVCTRRVRCQLNRVRCSAGDR